MGNDSSVDMKLEIDKIGNREGKRSPEIGKMLVRV